MRKNTWYQPPISRETLQHIVRLGGDRCCQVMTDEPQPVVYENEVRQLLIEYPEARWCVECLSTIAEPGDSVIAGALLKTLAREAQQ